MLGPQLGKHYYMIQYFCIYNNKDRYKIIHNYKFESTVYDKKIDELQYFVPAKLS